MYAHFCDFVDAYVGPFASMADVQAHVRFCEARGDAGDYLGTVDMPPEGAFVLTPEEDLSFELEAA